MARIISLGSIVCDRIFEVAAIPDEPVKVLAERYRESGGGMAATAACAIAALGGEAAFWGRVGDDADGLLLRRWLAEAGVEVAGLRVVPGARTPTSAVIVDPGGERLLAGFTGSGLGEMADWLPLHEVRAADAVLCDVRWPAGSQALLRAARRHGVPSVLDADIADEAVMAALITQADHVVFSTAGLAGYTGVADPEAALAALPPHPWASVGVTIGARGYLDRAAGHVAGRAVPVRDTNGAGDTFHGAFALAIARGASLTDAAAFANAAAAIKCRNGDGWRGMPTAAEVEALIEGRAA